MQQMDTTTYPASAAAATNTTDQKLSQSNHDGLPQVVTYTDEKYEDDDCFAAVNDGSTTATPASFKGKAAAVYQGDDASNAAANNDHTTTTSSSRQYHTRNLSQGHDAMDSKRSSSLLQHEEQFARVQSQVTVTTGATSDELSTILSNQAANMQTNKMAPTTQRPASANFATQQQRVRRIGSFVSSNHSDQDKMRYQDRVPVRLVFKHKLLEALAEANLRSRVVMALHTLTVNDFIDEVLRAMNSQNRIRKSRVEIVFFGKSVKSPFHFRGTDLLEKVHKKICSIEESRELSRHSSGEDLQKMAASAMASSGQPTSAQTGLMRSEEVQPVPSLTATQQRTSVDKLVAEISLTENIHAAQQRVSFGAIDSPHKVRRDDQTYRRKKQKEHGREKKYSRSHSGKPKSQSKETSCVIF